MSSTDIVLLNKVVQRGTEWSGTIVKVELRFATECRSGLQVGADSEPRFSTHSQYTIRSIDEILLRYTFISERTDLGASPGQPVGVSRVPVVRLSRSKLGESRRVGDRVQPVEPCFRDPRGRRGRTRCGIRSLPFYFGKRAIRSFSKAELGYRLVPRQEYVYKRRRLTRLTWTSGGTGSSLEKLSGLAVGILVPVSNGSLVPRIRNVTVSLVGVKGRGGQRRREERERRKEDGLGEHGRPSRE